jgi:hypothetical protein
MEFIVKVLSAPITWALILVLVITMQCKHLDKVNDSLVASKAQVEQLDKNIKIIREDQLTLTELMKKKVALTNKQTEIRTEIMSIPDTSTDRPFQDENTLRAAEKFRKYQENAIKED